MHKLKSVMPQENGLRSEARRASFHINFLVFLAGLINTGFIAPRIGTPVLPWQATCISGLIATIISRAARNCPIWASSGMIILNSFIVNVGGYSEQVWLAANGKAFAPFAGYKIAIITIALLAPSGFVGFVCGLMWVVNALLVAKGWPPQLKESVSNFEPWSTLGIWVISIGVLYSRRRLANLSRKAESAVVRQSWMERIAEAMLAVQDLTNSPLQSMEVTAALIGIKFPDLKEVAEKFLEHIREYSRLNQALRPLDQFVRWEKKGTSFNGIDEIREGVEASLRAGSPWEEKPKLPVLDSRREFSVAATLLSCIWMVGGAVAITLGYVKGHPIWMWIPVASLGFLGSLAFLFHLSTKACRALIYVQSLVMLCASYFADATIAQEGSPFSPFDSIKFFMVVVAVLAPGFRMGATVLGIAAIQPLVQYLSWSPEVRSEVAVQEPWMTTLIFGSISILELYFRRRQIEQLRKDVYLIAHQAWFERFVSLSLLVRRVSQLYIAQMQENVNYFIAHGVGNTELLDTLARNMKRIKSLNDVIAPLETQTASIAASALQEINPPDVLAEIKRQVEDCLSKERSPVA